MTTTSSNVASIITLLDDHTESDLDAFVTIANRFVARVLKDCDYEDEDLELIERYYAAHLYAVDNPEMNITSEGAGSIRETYQGTQIGKGLSSTKYGQMAISLDDCGVLANLEGPKVGGSTQFVWLGEETNG